MPTSVYEWVAHHKLTVADYHRMGQAGILEEGDRVELIEGELIDMTPIGSYHASAVNLLVRIFNSVVGDAAIVSVQAPITLGAHSEPQPDIALVAPREDYYRSAHPRASDVLLLIEVADTSLRYDREVKVPLYAVHGIPEVWIIDLENKRLETFRLPTGTQYRKHELQAQPSHATPARLTSCKVDLSLLW